MAIKQKENKDIGKQKIILNTCKANFSGTDGYKGHIYF